MADFPAGLNSDLEPSNQNHSLSPPLVQTKILMKTIDHVLKQVSRI